MLYDFSSTSLKKRNNLFNIVVILFLRYRSDTTSLALAYVEVQTWAELLMQNGIRGNLEIAGADGIGIVDELNKVSCVYHAAIWAEITGPVLYHTPGQEHLRKISGRDTYPRIGL